jgi:hypothetical protein
VLDVLVHDVQVLVHAPNLETPKARKPHPSEPYIIHQSWITSAPKGEEKKMTKKKK